jgi:hypothetical protein
MLYSLSTLLKLDDRLPMRRHHLGKERMSELPLTPAPPLFPTMSNEAIDRLLADITMAALNWLDLRANQSTPPD